MEKKINELEIITKAKNLCSYVMSATHKSPKEFRFSFVSRLQNLSLSIIENIFRANECNLKIDEEKNDRLKYQKEAGVNLRLLGYFAMLSYEQKCILMKQYEQISILINECLNLLGGWIVSDKKRFKSS